MKPNILPTNDQDLSWIIDDALSRLASRMEQAAPFMAQQIDRWTQELCQGSQGAYYKHPLGFPVLLFPWWLEKTVQRIPDTGFQADIVYSTINGYYFVRLIDNLMDGHTTRELRLLPALGFFHSQFQAPYQRYFDHRHPFWEYFERVWLQSAEVTIRDAHLTDLSWDEFLQIAAKKSCAAKIPLAAVCYRYGREDRIAPWSQFLDLFSRWHQMWNDVIGWHGDLRNGIGTLFLSEADRQRGLNESVTEWVIREGLGWGIDICRTWMDELRLLARGLNSNDLETYLQERESMLIEQKEQIAEGLQTVDRYLDLLSKT